MQIFLLMNSLPDANYSNYFWRKAAVHKFIAKVPAMKSGQYTKTSFIYRGNIFQGSHSPGKPGSWKFVSWNFMLELQFSVW